MGKSVTKVREEYRAKWDLPHSLENDYRRSKVKKEIKDLLEEEEEDIDLKPFWQEEVVEEQKD
jgi:hypothetical protein